MIFDSLNPYHNIEVLIAEGPEELVQMLKALPHAIQIVAINSCGGTRQCAYIKGDIRKLEPQTKTLLRKGK